MRILRFCISKRAAFLAGALPPAVFAPIAADWDAAVSVCLRRMFKGAAPHPRCRLRGPGGLDIHVVSAELSLLRTLSSSRAVDCIRAFMPRLAPLTEPTPPPTHPVHIELQVAWDSLPAAVTGAAGARHPLAPPPPPPPTSPAPPSASPPSNPSKANAAARRVLTTAFSAYEREALFLHLDDVDRVLLEASCAKGARAWADATPTYASRQMTCTQSRIAHCLWLGGTVAELAGASDPRGRAVLRADRAGRIQRHTAVLLAIGDLEKEAKRTVWQEVTGLFPSSPPSMPASARNGVQDGSLRRMDLVSMDRDLGGHLIDATVVDPATPDAVATAVTARTAEPNRVVDAAEAAKVAHYPDVPDGFRLCPVGLTTQAGCGALGMQYLDELGLILARRRNGTADPRAQQVAASRQEVRVRVGVALMRCLADQVAAAFADSPHAALASAVRYVHSALRAPGAGAGRGQDRRGRAARARGADTRVGRVWWPAGDAG